ncbi:hypothetical protein fugu_017993 [Takifugu bimaculatus]|uniref:Uncharacterized protein n=1 Tax=Takifugu bimaculatus TaxID=433685 RepID=A0A4Z2BJQ8_9TELE|nr:hypothetical protein fugu_017993 [Takifugu bimaculatus]
MTSRGGVSVLRTRRQQRQRAAARWSGESGGSLHFIGPQPHQRPPSPARNVRTREQKGGETLSSYSRLKIIQEVAKVVRRIAVSLPTPGSKRPIKRQAFTAARWQERRRH